MLTAGRMSRRINSETNDSETNGEPVLAAQSRRRCVKRCGSLLSPSRIFTFPISRCCEHAVREYFRVSQTRCKAGRNQPSSAGLRRLLRLSQRPVKKKSKKYSKYFHCHARAVPVLPKTGAWKCKTASATCINSALLWRMCIIMGGGGEGSC